MAEFRKPDITEGEWIFQDTGLSLNVGIKNDHPLVPIKPTLFDRWPHGFKKNRVADCKAISAVPEMIDALIYTYKHLQGIDIGEFTEDEMWLNNKIVDALTKAGCKIE